jgi:hypothetical protein
MLALVMVLVAGQVEVRGETESPTEVVLRRESARLRLGFGGMGAGGRGADTNVLVPGVMAEVGVVIGDRLSTSLRLCFGTVVTMWLAGVAVGVDYAITDQLTLGAGLGATLLGTLSIGLNLGIPLRLTFAPFVRPVAQVARTGLLLGVEVAPAYSFRAYAPRSFDCVQSGCPVSPVGLTGQLTIGCAWW